MSGNSWDYVVLTHDSHGVGRVTDGQTLLSRQVKLGEVCDVSSISHKLLLLKLDLQPSWRGRLMTFLYRAPRVNLEIETTDGAKLTYRIIPQMAHSSFLSSPLLVEPAHILAWYTHKPLKQTAKLRVVVEPGGESFFEDQVAVQVNEFPIMRR